MPNYLYKCMGCDHEEIKTLPMSSNPRATYDCPECPSALTRRIGKPQFTVERETLGKWFKEQTGEELLGDKC